MIGSGTICSTLTIFAGPHTKMTRCDSSVQGIPTKDVASKKLLPLGDNMAIYDMNEAVYTNYLDFYHFKPFTQFLMNWFMSYLEAHVNQHV